MAKQYRREYVREKAARGRAGMSGGAARSGKSRGSRQDWKLPPLPEIFSDSQKRANEAVAKAVRGIKKNYDTAMELFRWYGKKK